MKTILFILAFLVVFSAAKSFVGVVDNTASTLKNRATHIEQFYAANKIKLPK